jgi:sugar phosphate isomerase/epimerase
MHRIGIDFITALAMPPVEFVHLAADLGCPAISLALEPITPNPHDYPSWSLREDKALRRQTAAALKERNVSLALGEGFMARPGWDMRESAGDLEIMCELGAERVNAISIDPDLARNFDQFAILVEMADRAGVETTLEFGPIFGVPGLAAARDTLAYVGRPSFRLLIDMMHFARGGNTAAELAALPPDSIGYVQLCDIPATPDMEAYVHQARCERMVPGTGELPLVELVAALPADVDVGLEIPMVSAAEAGEGPRERIGRCLTAARAMLAGRSQI